MCGMVEGRLLHRYVDPSKPLDFNSGRCGSWIWFELPENPTCPFKEFCGAYLDKEPPKGLETVPPEKIEIEPVLQHDLKPCPTGKVRTQSDC